MVQSIEQSAYQILLHLMNSIYKDPLTDSVVGIDTVHHEVHAGHAFTASYKTPDASPIADNATLEVLIRVGSTFCAHMFIDPVCGGEAEVEVFEGPDVTAVGTVMTAYNMSRESANGSEVTVFHTPTIGGGGDGTLLLNTLVPGGTKKEASGGAIRPGMEWIFNRDTDYLIVLTNRAGAAQQVSIQTQWYEHL